MSSNSQENLISSDPETASAKNERKSSYDSIPDDKEYVLNAIEKQFLLNAERGDCAGVRR